MRHLVIKQEMTKCTKILIYSAVLVSKGTTLRIIFFKRPKGAEAHAIVESMIYCCSLSHHSGMDSQIKSLSLIYLQMKGR